METNPPSRIGGVEIMKQGTFDFMFEGLTAAFGRKLSEDQRIHWFNQMKDHNDSMAATAIDELSRGEKFPTFKDYHGVYGRIKRGFEDEQTRKLENPNALPPKLNHHLFKRLLQLQDHPDTDWDMERQKMKDLNIKFKKGMTAEQGIEIVKQADLRYGIPGEYK